MKKSAVFSKAEKYASEIEILNVRRAFQAEISRRSVLKRRFTVRLVQGTGANQVTFPVGIHWSGERPPLLAYESGMADLVTFTWDGAHWLGLHEGSWFNVSSPA
ncbi:hypothetical protein [Pseudomonas fluorescens]|uniref:hypothetical protein n=1 Tax=Pseudomonas fluorescens TaxID=294 RepID=UPI00124287EF|nr:hypothetical protein [Pseudomonas fluorescens]